MTPEEKQKIITWIEEHALYDLIGESAFDGFVYFINAMPEESDNIVGVSDGGWLYWVEHICKCGRSLKIPVEKYEIETQIAKRKYLEYHEWLSQWNGDEPDEREYTTFVDWLDREEE